VAMVKVVVACAPFKGTWSAKAITAHVAQRLRDRGHDVDERPLPDGGEDTAAVLGDAWGLRRKAFIVPHVLGQPTDALTPVDAQVGDREGRPTAIIESAACVGLTLVPPESRDPLHADTRAIGALIRAVVDDGAREVVLCLGGTGTVDGGRGLLDVMPSLPPGVALAGLVDVWAPLGGADGARRFFAQKGLGAEHHDDVEAALCALHPRFVDVPGEGAAGGLGAAVLHLGGVLRSGAEVVVNAARLDDALRDADVVIGGEGRVDETTTQGKSLWALRAAARRHGVPLVVVCGENALGADVADAVVELKGDPALSSLDGAIAAVARRGTH